MITVVCPYFGTGGMWRHSRSFVRALNRYEPVALRAWETPDAVDDISEDEHEMLARPRDPANVTLALGPIVNMADVEGDRRIFHVVWEPTRLPFRLRRILRRAETIWVPSRWGRELLRRNRIAGDRIRIVPEGVDSERFRPASRPRPDGGPFRFLCVGKWESRKGVADLVRVYSTCFERTDDVELVLHCANRFLPHLDLPSAVRAASGRDDGPRIELSSAATEEDMLALYQSCDAFVLPTKAEGWGLPIIEAMACGLPVIVTDYSAYRDFVDETCGYLVRVAKMVPVDDRTFYPRGCGYWAQPDLAHLAELMRHVREDREESRARGRIARERVARQWTWDEAARIACAQLHGGAVPSATVP